MVSRKQGQKESCDSYTGSQIFHHHNIYSWFVKSVVSSFPVSSDSNRMTISCPVIASAPFGKCQVGSLGNTWLGGALYSLCRWPDPQTCLCTVQPSMVFTHVKWDLHTFWHAFEQPITSSPFLNGTKSFGSLCWHFQRPTALLDVAGSLFLLLAFAHHLLLSYELNIRFWFSFCLV